MTTATQVRRLPVTDDQDAAVRVGVLTWNVQHSNAERGIRQVDWLADQASADIVVLTELGSATATASLVGALTGHGYLTLTAVAAQTRGVLIASRVGALVAVDVGGFGPMAHRFLAARADLPGGGCLGVAGLYVPSRGPARRRNVDKRAFQDLVAAALPRLADAFGPGVPVMLAGDLNVVEPGHQPHLPVFGAWEYDFYRAFAASGYTDAYRHRHPAGHDHSWSGRSGTGYRLDHIFCSAGLLHLIEDCRYLHEPRQRQLSDHSALTAYLSLSGIPA